MNRADTVRALAACEALTAELRRALRADALAEFTEQGCAPTWRLPGYTVVTSVTHGGPEVVDMAALLAYVAEQYPTEVVVVRQVRSAWLAQFLAEVAKRGAPCDADGQVVPGLGWREGGEFKTVSITPAPEARAELRRTARDMIAGKRPLALPSTEDGAS